MSTIVDIGDIVEPVAPAVLVASSVINWVAVALLVFILLAVLHFYRRRLSLWLGLYRIDASSRTTTEKLASLYSLISKCEAHQSRRIDERQHDWAAYLAVLEGHRFSRTKITAQDWQALLKETRRWVALL